MLLLSGTVINLVGSTAITVLIPNEERGLCMAAFGMINAVIGLSLAPTIVTLGSSAMGCEHHLAMSLAITGAVTGVVSLLGYIIAAKTHQGSSLATRHDAWADLLLAASDGTPESTC